MLVNAASLRTLGIGFSATFQGGLAGVSPTWQRVAMKVPSTTTSNEYGWLGQFPRVREWIGDRVIRSLDVSGYTIRNRKFELTVAVKADDIKDDNIGIYAPMMSEMGRAVASFPDELVWPLMAAGFVTPCYDGQYFFDTDHPVLDAAGNTTSVSNFGGGSGAPWFLLDLSRAVKPMVFQDREPFTPTFMDAPTDEVVFMRDEYRYGSSGRCNAGYGLWQLAYASKQPLTSANYAAARAAMTGQKGDYGRPLGIRSQVLLVPPTLEEAGRQVLLAQQQANGATNVWQNSAELMVEPWLG